MSDINFRRKGGLKTSWLLKNDPAFRKKWLDTISKNVKNSLNKK